MANLVRVGWVSALDNKGRIWIVDAQGYGKRFVLPADEMLTAPGRFRWMKDESAKSPKLQFGQRVTNK